MKKFFNSNIFKILILYFALSFLIPQLGIFIPFIVIYFLFFSIFKIFEKGKIKPSFISIFFLFFFLWTLFLFVAILALIIIFIKNNNLMNYYKTFYFLININFALFFILLTVFECTLNIKFIENFILINPFANKFYVKRKIYLIKKAITLETIIKYRYLIASI
ncbi:hypothetical protein [Mesoplasma florum]|uniref:hypothetical protein n=1 Tax=Mesoplasma florum TaxID=2151 RepID=UPI00059DDF54|nr:hypothetical protein [Mesoplasma florum]AVN59540.1 hypothetical protein CG008_01300 [Mesoplasma florum]